MEGIPYAYSNGHLSVEVHLTHAADVFLVDSSNLRKYQSDEEFKYYGGHYTYTPVEIEVTGSGYWYLIVEGGGNFKYRFF